MSGSRPSRVLISGIVLAIFWSAILHDYWPSLAPAALRLVNATRSVGAATMESSYFEVHNKSAASESQVQAMIQELNRQYLAIRQVTGASPAGQVQVLVVNGHGPVLIDGEQLVVNDDNGKIDTSLAPFFLVFLIDDIKINPAGEIAAPGGYALQVVEAAGLGQNLIRQPLDAWTVLLRQRNAYVPLDDAWKVVVPNDENSLYALLRAMLESGSFMRWFAGKYGLDAARRVARGETVQDVTGRTLAENEADWLKALDTKKIQPKACETVIPPESVFRIICTKMEQKGKS